MSVNAFETEPYDDEPVTEEDRRRLRDGQEFFAQGKGIPMDDVLAELNLKPDDFTVTR